MTGPDLMLETLRVPGGAATTAAASPAPAGSGSRFLERAQAVFQEANALQHDAEAEAQALAAGEGSTVETMVALSKADLSLRLVVAMRNRALAAYEDLMRMQV